VATTENLLPAIPQITASGNTSFCTGGSVDLSSSYATGNLWSNGATTQTITVTATGSSTVTHTDANGCSSTSGAVNTSSSNSPQPSVSVTGNTTFCQGDTVVLTSSQGDSYLWSPGGATTQSISVVAGGSYTVSVTNADPCDGTGTSSATVVTVNPAPAPVVSVVGLTTFCDGGSVVLTSELADSYLWTPGGATTQSISATTSGSYTVLVNNDNACFGSGSSAAVNVTVNNNPVAAAAIGTTDGLTVTFENTSTGATNYVWDFGNNGGASLVAEPTFTYGVEGNYTVTLIAENAAGCADTTDVTVSVTVGIEEKEAFNSISLYPNPTANITNLNFNLKNESDVQVLVFDIAGKIIFEAKETNVLTGENNIAIDMTNMNNGIYFVTIKADKAVVAKRLFVNK
jgi:PKD repeat protein